MLKHIYILIIMIAALCSCSPDLSQQIVEDDCISLTVYSTTMGTKADYVPDQGLERERLLNRLDIFLYPSGQTECKFHKTLTGLGNTSGTQVVPVYVSDDIEAQLFPGEKTECDVFVLANIADSVMFTGHETIDTLKKMTIVSKDFSKVVASDGSFVMPEPFVMSGESKATKVGETISGNVSLKRAASKVTISLLIPEYINVDAKDASENVVRKEVWRPYFIDSADPSKGVYTMHMGYHKGVFKTFVDGDNNAYINDEFETLYTEDFTYDGDGSIEKDGKKYYKYNCDVSFYSYAFSWEGQENEVRAPYFTLMIPWKRDEAEGVDERFTTYYYQVVVNGKSKKLERNYWYDINLEIGVLGSRTYNVPVEIQGMSCYVLDWSAGTAGLKEDVALHEWRYLVVPETYIEMNNTDKGYLPFEASHKVAWTLEWPGSLEGLDDIEKYNNNNKYSTYYINCSGKTPVSVQLSGVNNGSFKISDSGDEIVLTNAIPANVYSPIYYHLKVWLDLNSNGVLDAEEQSFVERVVFVQYPPIYIIPSQSKAKSVYVNKVSYTTSNISYNNSKYILGQCRGESTDGDHMYVINVSSFNADDTFKYRDNQNYTYMIGDPRVLVSDADLNDDNYDMAKDWATDINERKLQYYYPTTNNRDSMEPNIFRVISPKFRVASFLGGYSSGSTPEGAAMRCASYQEDGYPAGRWRLPTTAEINFVISLQQKGAIQNIFYGGNYYYSSTDQVQNQSTINIREIKWNESNFTGSIRCVYDEWYWGSEREAKLKNGSTDEYEFTWGDAPR